MKQLGFGDDDPMHLHRSMLGTTYTHIFMHAHIFIYAHTL